MDLFKFLKKKQVDNFEAILKKAADDPLYRPEFINRILNEKLLIVTNDDVIPGGGFGKVEAGLKINVFTLKDGRVPVFTSKERIHDKGIFESKANFLEAKGADIFGFLKGATLVINPYSDYGKEFNPSEVERLLNGTYFTDNATQIKIKKPTVVNIAQPAIYPTEIVKSLITLFSTKPEVKAAYLGWIQNPATNEPPHYIFAIDTSGEWKDISGEAGFLAQQCVGKNDIIDFIQIKNKGFIDDYFINQTKPFYIKET